jgi:hypothetical protein
MGRGTKARRAYEEAVGYLCRHAEDLRAAVDPSCWEPAIAIIRDDDPSSPRWQDAVLGLHQAAEAAGIPGGLGLRFPMNGFPPRPIPRTAGWVCPHGRCARVELRDEPGTNAPQCAAPQCTLSGRPMRLVD